jgi:hypothetical protein
VTVIGTVVSDLIAAPLPVLIGDTCSLLDILRAPARLDPGELRAAMLIWEALTQPQRTVCLILPEIIWKREIPQRRESAEATLDEFLNRYKDASKQINWWCDVVGAPKTDDPGPIASGLAKSFADIFDGIFGSAIQLDKQLDCVHPAYERVEAKRAPAHRKGEIKDAVIVEESLELARQLRQRSFSPPIVLLSANKVDYFDDSGALHSDLAADFDSLGITFCLTWKDARRALNL